MGIKFAHVEYSMGTKSLDLFVVGCAANPPCEDCCNPEIRNFNLDGMSCEAVLKKVKELNKTFDKLITRFILVGGDFVDNYKVYPDEMISFLTELRKLEKPLYLFTRHELNEIPRELLELVDYVKTGAYIPSLKCDDNIQEGIKLATSNQKIFKVSEILV